MEETTVNDQMIENTATALAEMQSTSKDKMVETSDTPQITMIRELQPTSYGKMLEVRVYRKWIAVTYAKKGDAGFSPKKTETAYCCILIDQEGNAIQANMNVKEIGYFDSKLNLGSTYRISKFICEPTNPYQQTINNRTSLKFGRITKFNIITAPQIPHHYFSFVSYNQLQSRLPKQDERGRTQYPILTDYIGCLRSVGELNRKQDANQDETLYRKLDIETLSGNIIEFTMWDEMASKFEEDNKIETMEHPVIIAVSSCRVTRFREYQLTATSATQCYLNPKIPEVEQLRAQYKAKHKATPPLRICKTPYADIGKEKFRNRFPLKTLLKQEAETYRGVQFTTEATITSINIKRDWFYISCNECPQKAKEEDGMYKCVDHGKQEKPLYRYNFKAFITDPSATAPVTFFSPAGDAITGYSCSDLLAMHKTPDPQEIPPEIFAIEGTKNVFQIRFNQTAKTTDFIVDRVFNAKNEQEITTAAIEPKPDSPTSEAPTTLLALTDHNNEGQKTDEENKPQAVKRALFQDEQPSVKKQKATTESSAPEKTKTRGSENKKQG